MMAELKVERSLQEIVPFMNLPESYRESVVTGLAVDSRKVSQGDCFIAYPGHFSDGREFLDAALKAGAAAALVEAEGFTCSEDISVPVVAIDDLKSHLGEVASAFFGEPSRSLRLIAITGTNGKTSVSQLVAQSLTFLELRCGVIGTLGNGLVGHLEDTVNTTPDIVECNRILARLRAEGAQLVAMETSSHGLVQGRVSGLSIFCGLVTNISRDHLDYHGTMEAYAEAKARLVRHPGLQHLVLNLDDARVAAMSDSILPETRLWTFSLQNRDDATVCAAAVHFGRQGMEIRVRYDGREVSLHSGLIGEFNAANLLSCLTLLLVVGVSLNDAALALSHANPVTGRMQRVATGADQPMVVIDFAHTPDALEKALTALRRHAEGKIWCVFGCGGERDKGKRPLMAEVVSGLADEIVVTSDNPRSEKFTAIASDMVKGIPSGTAFQTIENRTDAIAFAIDNAVTGDVVLIAGKGHEQYQEVQGVKYEYSDLDAASLALSRSRGTTSEGC